MGSQRTTPQIRPGVKGLIDRFIGPGATRAEILLQTIPSLVAGIGAATYAWSLPTQWNWMQMALITTLGFDVVGGILTNATAAAKRWYHRPGQHWPQHMNFIALHVIHIGLVTAVLRGADWSFFFGVSGYLLIAAAAIVFSPLYLQRPIALGLYAMSVVGDRYLVTPTYGLEWFLPLFFLKLLVSHLPKETPFSSHDR